MRIKLELIVFVFLLVFQRCPCECTAKGPVYSRTGGSKYRGPSRSWIYLCEYNPQLLGGHSQERKRKLCSFDGLLRHLGNRERFHLCSEVQVSGRKTCVCGSADACKRLSDPWCHQFTKRGGQWRAAKA